MIKHTICLKYPVPHIENNYFYIKNYMLLNRYKDFVPYYHTMSNTAAFLKIAINSSNKELIEKYRSHISKHNIEMRNNQYPNAGFDLFVPDKHVLKNGFKSQMIDLKVKCEMIYENKTTGFYMFPRSSISKTPLILANHTGIIDSGYRGSLMAAVRNLDDNEYLVEQDTRLFQICHPLLYPIFVEMVEESDLSSTERNDGGFGSTGK